MSRPRTGIPVPKNQRMCRKSNVKPPLDDNVNWERIMSRPPYPIASLDLNHIGSYTSHAHDFQRPDNIIMVRSTDQRTIAHNNGTQPPKLKTVTVSTVETYNRNQNTVRKLTTKSVDGVLESKETIVTDATRAPLLGSQVNLRTDKLKSPSSNSSTPLRSQTLPRAGSNVSLRSVPRTPQKTKDINRDEFSKQCLERHNEFRAKHKLDPLKLSSELSSFAQEWADHLASILKMTHRPNNKYGENLWMYMTTDRSHRVQGGDAVDSWYSGELSKYKFGTEPRNLEAGHLTQVLWASSDYLGVGIAKNGDYTFVVCNYDPPGNYKGEYADSVPPIGGWKNKPSAAKRPGVGFSATADSLDAFVKETLRIHNEYRARHGVQHLSLDPAITKYAQSWADHLAEKNLFSHRSNSPYGENIFWSSGNASPKVMCDSWYGEENGYQYDVDPFKSGGGLRSGHFTQMVWKESKHLGVGRAFAKNGAMIAVANYSPRGNIIGQFTANVMAPGRKR